MRALLHIAGETAQRLRDDIEAMRGPAFARLWWGSIVTSAVGGMSLAGAWTWLF